MLGKKSYRMVDLEYMIPKEHMEEMYEEDVVSFRQLPLQELCYCCARNSDEEALVAVFYRGKDRWVCTKCLKRAMEPEAPKAQTYEASSPYFSETQGPYNPMSMFD